MVRISGLTKRYRNVLALDGVSFTVRGGEVLGLIGPNGSGKTTLFECIGGVLPFDAGAINYDGSEQPATFYVPDGIAPGLLPNRPGAREAVIESLQLAPLLDVRIGHLSKGQRKRALLAFGLVTPRPIVLADEFTTEQGCYAEHVEVVMGDERDIRSDRHLAGVDEQ